MERIKFPLVMDCVYAMENTPEGADETVYRKASVRVTVGDTKAEVSVTPENAMTFSELSSILGYLDSTTFKRARLSLNTDCIVVLHQNGQSYLVQLEDDSAVVKGLTPRE